MDRNIALGFRAARGGSVVVGVAFDGAQPHVVLSRFLATAEEGDRLAFEPYHVAAEVPRGSNGEVQAAAAAAVAEGRSRQARLAMQGLDALLSTVREARCRPVVASLLVNRAGWITDLLQYSLSAPEHPAVAEGLAVREALRLALATHAIDAVEVDEKSLPEIATATLRVPRGDLDARLKELGTTVGRPWRKEHKLSCLAAWLALAERAGAVPP